jgi:hypothetical protein
MSILLTYPPRVSLTDNPVEIQISTSMTGVTNHFLHLRVTDADTLVYIELIQPVINGKTIFDISEVGKSIALKTGIDYADIEIRTAIQAIKNYGLTAYETYNNDGIEHNLFTANTYFFIKGGFSKRLFKQYESNGFTFYEKFVQEGRFLTWQPDNKIISQNDIEKLYFYNLSYTTVKIKIIVCYKDLRTDEIVRTYTGQTLDTIIEINSGFYNSGISETAENPVIYYDISLMNSSDVTISETRRYYIDRSYFPYTKKFYFRNSFGTFDCLRSVGLSEKNTEFDFAVNQYDLRKKQNVTSDTIQTTNSGIINNFNKNTKQYIEYLNELFLSEEVYFVDEKNNSIPILIISKSLNTAKDNQFIKSIEFEYYIDDNDSHYSDLLTDQNSIAEFSYDFNLDFNA